MLITRRSPRTGEENTMDLPVTQEQLDEYARGGRTIQSVFPGLTAGQREFLKTGYTPEDWAAMFPPEESEE